MDIEDTPLMAGSAPRSTQASAAGDGETRPLGAVSVRRPPAAAGRRSRSDGNTDEAAAIAASSSPAIRGVPEGNSVFLHTFGCGHNVSDGEYMGGQLAEAGYIVSEDFDRADCFVINSCTVKNPSEDHFVTMLRRAQATGKPVVVAGCVPQGDPKNKQWADVSVVGVRQIDQIAYVVNEALQGNTVRLLGKDAREESDAVKRRANASEDAHSNADESTNEGGHQRQRRLDVMPPLALPKVRRNKFVEIVPINVGCLNFCTYCKTKHARGDLKSWPVDEIVSRVRAVVAEGVVEIRMTSEDTGAYGIDIGTDIVQLMRAVVKELEGTRVMLRLGMSNPPYLLRHVDAMCDILRHPNVFEYLHLPVQSGADAILDAMKREYSAAEFCHCVDTFTKNVPHMAISTDIICAFPGEGESEWQATMDLCRKYKFPYLNISRFYARRDTPAAAMKQISTNISKARSVELTELFNSYGSFNDFLVGQQRDMWVTEVAHDKHFLVGHTKEGFVQVLLDPKETSLGDHVTVLIESATKYHVRGKVLKVNARAGILASSPTAAAASSSSAAGLRSRNGRLRHKDQAENPAAAAPATAETSASASNIDEQQQQQHVAPSRHGSRQWWREVDPVAITLLLTSAIVGIGMAYRVARPAAAQKT